MRNYFGIALRSNVCNLVGMKSAGKSYMCHIYGYHDISRYIVSVSKRKTRQHQLLQIKG